MIGEVVILEIPRNHLVEITGNQLEQNIKLLPTGRGKGCNEAQIPKFMAII